MKALLKYRPRFVRGTTRSNSAIMRVSRTVLILQFAIAGIEFPQSVQAQSVTSGCPAGTKSGTTNFIRNGNFANGNQEFTTDLPYRGDRVYPDDPIGGISVQAGSIQYLDNVVNGQPFPGDPANSVPASNTYLYSNPNQKPDGSSAFPNPTIWRQTVTGLQPNTTYRFIGYFYNLLTPNSAGVPPIIILQVDGSGSINTAAPISVTTRQQWLPVQYSFTTQAGQTQATLSIIDQANDVVGDDFGLTAIALNQCIPNLGVAKSAGTPIANSNGTFTVPYTVRVRNYGTDTISNVQLTESLTQTFANAANFTVDSQSLSGTGLTPNTSFNGRGNNNLLAGSDSLTPGASATVSFNVTITPGTGANGSGPFDNSVTATGTAPGNIPVSDVSTNGTGTNPNPDPDGDSDPSNNTSPTTVSLTLSPRLGVAKAVGTITNNNDGSFTVPYTIIVQNVGRLDLNNLQLTENLANTFNGASEFTVVANSLRSIGNTSVTVNPNFNGTSNTNLLAGTDSLPVGATASVQYNVRVTPGNKLGPYDNTVIGTARTTDNTPAQDISTNGSNVDPNGDGDPGNDNVPTRVNFADPLGNAGNGRLRLVKRITNASRGGAAISGLSFTGVDADADANAINSAGLRPVGVRAIDATNPLQSGDEVEYTIYFLSDGEQAVNNVNFCDLIPTGTSYVSNSTLVQIGNTQPSSTGRFFSSLTPLPTGNSCIDKNNPNGAVIVNLGNVSNAPGGNFGYVRLRVRIN